MGTSLANLDSLLSPCLLVVTSILVSTAASTPGPEAAP
jgi:hypothetical protein